MSETFLTRTSHSNLTQTTDLTPKQAQMDGMVSTFMEKVLDVYPLAGFVLAGRGAHSIRSGVLTLSRSLLNFSPRFAPIAQASAIATSFAFESVGMDLFLRLLRAGIGAGDISLLNIYGNTGIAYGSVGSAATLLGFRLAEVIGAHQHSITRNLLQMSAIMASHEASALAGIMDHSREELGYRLIDAEANVLQLGAAIGALHRFTPSLAQSDPAKHLSIYAKEMGNRSASLRQQKAMAMAAMGIADDVQIPNEVTSIKKTPQVTPQAGVLNLRLHPPEPLPRPIEGDHWQVIYRQFDPESGGYYYTAQRKRTFEEPFFESDIRIAFRELPQLAERLGVIEHRDGSITYPDAKATNHRLGKQIGFLFLPVEGKITSQDVILGLAKEPPELPYSVVGGEHFHDIGVHLAGDITILGNPKFLDRVHNIARVLKDRPMSAITEELAQCIEQDTAFINEPPLVANPFEDSTFRGWLKIRFLHPLKKLAHWEWRLHIVSDFPDLKEEANSMALEAEHRIGSYVSSLELSTKAQKS
jgi:cell division protein ZapA (FtsZ GTPase activity inhibitor)